MLYAFKKFAQQYQMLNQSGNFNMTEFSSHPNTFSMSNFDLYCRSKTPGHCIIL